MHLKLVTPDMDLIQPAKLPAAKPVPPPADVLARLMELRDEMTHNNSGGRHADAAGREWAGLPQEWRMAFLLLAGVGREDDLATLATRSWQKMPPAERAEVRAVVRAGKRHMSRLVALAARV